MQPFFDQAQIIDQKAPMKNHYAPCYINKENKIETFLEHLEKNLYRFKKSQGIVGITLNGGLARGYGDHLSEVDITLFLEDDTYKAWNQGYADICTGICIVDSLIYDIKYVSYSEEMTRNLSFVVELWDLSYAKILWDPTEKIKTFLDHKLSKECDIAQLSQLILVVLQTLHGYMDVQRKSAPRALFVKRRCKRAIASNFYR